MSTPPVADEPTDEQLSVIRQPVDSRTLLIAPAGTGKTFTVVRRIEHLLEEGLAPDEILTLSFSRAAVAELAKRTQGRTRLVDVRTFDAWALDLLRNTYSDEEWGHWTFDERIAEATTALAQGDTEHYTHRIRHVLLDEVQDLVGARQDMVRALLTALDCGFTVVGDPAQAIYRFQQRAGTAEGDVFTWLRATYADDLEETALSRDFRARKPREPALIACGVELRTSEVAEQTIRSIRHRFLDLLCVGTVGEIAGGLAHQGGTSAVLCRDNGQVLQVSAELHEAGVPHRVQGRAGEVGFPAWVADLLRHDGRTIDEDTFRAGTGATDSALAWAALRGAAGAGSNRVDLDRLRTAFASGRHRLLPDPAAEPVVSVSSMHRAKGLEYDHVFILENPARDHHDALDEARLLYMAMTRSREDLFRLEAIASGGPLHVKRCKANGRWARYHFRRHRGRYGLAVEPGDVSADLPAGTAVFTDDPAELQLYLARRVRPGDSVTLERADTEPADELPAPMYVVRHDGRPIGVVSTAFREALSAYLFDRGEPRPDARWPHAITQCRVDDVETVFGSTAAGKRFGLGNHGAWLAPRLTGLTWFQWEDGDTADE
ncbi:hypothetical protein Q0Z83_001540 [Actinoplanes sichuanensis]|uniref:UvrD-helicase domain-containing protein n=1 Tax=Actinoplanes sichuanensis TaxID=512349 RepID=A0ABW4AUU6_9ACTN|nr:UvrD-helicase domain-containing protein [Actinoplanes sichuanensis]BEL01963.1 hypothetical protein Q0Z83_001540 [Actinoplanes sichuanensis]